MGLRPHYLMELVLGVRCSPNLAIYWLWSRNLQAGLALGRVSGLFGPAVLLIHCGVILARCGSPPIFLIFFVQWVRDALGCSSRFGRLYCITHSSWSCGPQSSELAADILC